MARQPTSDAATKAAAKAKADEEAKLAAEAAAKAKADQDAKLAADAAAQAKADEEAKRAAEADAKAKTDAEAKAAADAAAAQAKARSRSALASDEHRWFLARSPILDGTRLIEAGEDIALTRAAYDALKSGGAIAGDWDTADVAD